MIRVFIGSSERFKPVEHYIANSIRRNTAERASIHFIRPLDYNIPEHGCTGFTNMRFAVPEIAGNAGFAIYLDVDMLVIGDLAELWDYRISHSWVCIEDGSTEVMVIDCQKTGSPAGYLPDLDKIHEMNKAELTGIVRPLPRIPLSWNCEDEPREDMKLLHFTDLKRQPYFYDHPHKHILEGYGHQNS